MAKFDKASVVAQLAAKGLDMTEENPNLEKVAQSMGILTAPQHEARVISYSSKDKGEVPMGTKGSKNYLAISGGARGREAWFPVVNDSGIDTLTSVREACDLALQEIADAVEADDSDK